MNRVGIVILSKTCGTDDFITYDFINILLANGYTVTIKPIEDKLKIEIYQEA